MNNSTFSVLELCPNETMERCYNDVGWKITVVFINFLSLGVNVFHLIVISKLPSLRGTQYLLILQQISISDIYSTLPSVKMLCSIHQFLYGKDIRFAVLYVSVTEHCALIRHSMLAVACLERYISICCPYNRLSLCGNECTWRKTSQIKAFIISVWIFSYVYIITKNYLFKDSLCLWAVYGPASKDYKSGLVNLTYITVLLLCTLVCSTKIFLELREVNRRNPHNSDTSVKRAAHYIIIINIAYYVCLIPTTAAVITATLRTNASSHLIPVRWMFHIFYCIYGIINVLIYGWAMKPYRTLVRQILTCRLSAIVPMSKGSLDTMNRQTVATSTNAASCTIEQNTPSQDSVTTPDDDLFVVGYAKPVKQVIEADLTSGSQISFSSDATRSRYYI